MVLLLPAGNDAYRIALGRNFRDGDVRHPPAQSAVGRELDPDIVARVAGQPAVLAALRLGEDAYRSADLLRGEGALSAQADLREGAVAAFLLFVRHVVRQALGGGAL